MYPQVDIPIQVILTIPKLRIALTKPVISSADSPLIERAVKRAACFNFYQHLHSPFQACSYMPPLRLNYFLKRL